MSDEDSEFGCFGCLIEIIVVLIIFALICGVTIGGIHYEVSCGNCNEGIIINSDERPQSEPEPEHPPIRDVEFEDDDVITPN